MIEYLIHGLLAIPLTFLALKFLSYLAREPITRGTALMWCVFIPLAGTPGLIFAFTFAVFLGICALSKYLGQRGGWFDKPI